jgi:hypothetical protein
VQTKGSSVVVGNCFHGICSELKLRASGMEYDFQHHVFERDLDSKQEVFLSCSSLERT